MRTRIGAGIRYDAKDERLKGWTIHRDEREKPPRYELRYQHSKRTEHRTLAQAIRRAEEAVGIERPAAAVSSSQFPEAGEGESPGGWGGREVPEIFR